MNLNEFLEKHAAYSPRIVDSFLNQWPIFKAYHATTYIIAFEGQADNKASMSLTCQNGTGDIIEADIDFRDYRVIYVRQYDKADFLETCKSYSVDPLGTKNVYEMGDYIPNVYVDEDELNRATKQYADACDLVEYPYYLGPVEQPEPDESVPDVEEVQGKTYRVFFNVQIGYQIDSAANMDDALAQASESLYNDLDFKFDDDSIVVLERAVFETVNGANHV